MNHANQLLSLALQARNNAYAPYSGFMVGAAIYSADGHFFTGCNVENISYPCGTCAEAGAICAMVASGCTEINEILIVADTENILPCGNCLQKITEFATPHTLVHSADISGNIRTYSLNQLLPHAFNSEEVKNA